MAHLSEIQIRQYLTNLDDHILENIFAELGVDEVVRLRQLSKRLNYITRSRQLWMVLARVCVLNLGLPWPEYALPIESQSFETIETLTIRAILLHSVWDNEIQPPPSICRPIRWYRYPTGDRVTWMEFIRSRWLLVGLRSGWIGLWDVDADGQSYGLVSCTSLEGWPVAGVVQDEGAIGVVEAIISTSTSNTYVFAFDVSQLRHHPQTSATTVDLSWIETFHGYDAIKGAHQNLLAFTRSVNSNLPCVLDRRTSTAVSLLGDEDVPNSVIGIQIRQGIIAVAKDMNIELYHTSDAIHAFSATPTHDTPAPIPFFRSLRYPRDRMIWDASFITPSDHGAPAQDPSTPPSFVLGVMEGHLFSRWTLLPGEEAAQSSGSGTPPPSYKWREDSSPRTVVAVGSANGICWGQSGRRIVFSCTPKVVHSPSLYTVFVPETFTRPRKLAMQNTRCYDLPDNGVKEVAWVCAFDEATGRIASTAAGEVFVVDVLSSLLTRDCGEPKGSDEGLDSITRNTPPDSSSSTQHLSSGKMPVKEYASDFTDVALPMRTTRTDHCPPPPSWPAWAPINPEGFGGSNGFMEINYVRSQAPHIPANTIQWRFSNEWSRYSEVKQWHNHYGSMQWFFNEVMHLRGRVIPILFGDFGGPDDGVWQYASDEDEDGGRDLDQDHPCFGLYDGRGHTGPIDALTRKDEPKKGIVGQSVILEVNGQYYLHTHNNYETLHIRGAITVEDVLLWTHGAAGIEMEGPLDLDMNALHRYNLWSYCARATRRKERTVLEASRTMI